MSTFPLGDKDIKIAMLGMTEGNGHPYSWSIMINGSFDADALAACPYPAIGDYIFKQPPETLGIAGATVTHICCEDPVDAADVAKTAHIPNVIERPEDAIGEVDAVIVGTDIGSEHVERARPFVEAGLPVFIDKPLCDNRADLKTFSDWVAEGKPIMSSSSARYTKEFAPYHRRTYEFGDLRSVFMTMAKKWETYGIHAIEAIYPIVGPGFVSVRNTGEYARNNLHIKHSRGIDINLVVTGDLLGGSGFLTLAGTKGGVQLRPMDSYFSFKTQLDETVKWFRTGERPYPFSETEELARIIIAGIESREQGGREIFLSEMEN